MPLKKELSQTWVIMYKVYQKHGLIKGYVRNTGCYVQGLSEYGLLYIGFIRNMGCYFNGFIRNLGCDKYDIGQYSLSCVGIGKWVVR